VKTESIHILHVPLCHILSFHVPPFNIRTSLSTNHWTWR